jgi:hypothetical protein
MTAGRWQRSKTRRPADIDASGWREAPIKEGRAAGKGRRSKPPRGRAHRVTRFYTHGQEEAVSAVTTLHVSQVSNHSTLQSVSRYSLGPARRWKLVRLAFQVSCHDVQPLPLPVGRAFHATAQ